LIELDYPFDFREEVLFIEKGGYGPFDENGIPRVDYRKKTGLQYNPATISQYALGNFQIYSDNGDEKRKNIALKMAEWLLRKLVILPKDARNSRCGVWHYHFDWPIFKVKAPWASALSQGEGISVLVRAHHLLNDRSTLSEDCLESAWLAFESFNRNVKDGGVMVRDKSGRIWFEEYHSVPPTFVLNGFIFSLLGIYDLWKATGDSRVENLWKEGAESLRDSIEIYDNGYDSIYDRVSRGPVDEKYHRTHIRLVEIMHDLTKFPIFSKVAERWKGYLAKGLQKPNKWELTKLRIRKIFS